MNKETVRTIPLFASVSKRRHEEVARLADDVDVPAGSTLTKQGGGGREFFIVVEGTADVLRDGQHVGTLWPGDFFGEIGMLSSNWLRTETVVAASPMRLLVVGRREFQTMLVAFPAVAEAVRSAASARKAEFETRRGLRTNPTSVQPTALVPPRPAERTGFRRRASRVLAVPVRFRLARG